MSIWGRYGQYRFGDLGVERCRVPFLRAYVRFGGLQLWSGDAFVTVPKRARRILLNFHSRPFVPGFGSLGGSPKPN